MNTKESPSFETSYKRLEDILELLSTEEVSLEKSVQLFEEANKLIQRCTKQLETAEQKIEIIQKNKEGHIETSDKGEPLLDAYAPEKNGIIHRTSSESNL